MRVNNTRSHAWACCIHHRRTHVRVPATTSLALGSCSHMCFASRPQVRPAGTARPRAVLPPPPLAGHLLFVRMNGHLACALPRPLRVLTNVASPSPYLWASVKCRAELRLEPHRFRKAKVNRSSPGLVACKELELRTCPILGADPMFQPRILFSDLTRTGRFRIPPLSGSATLRTILRPTSLPPSTQPS